RDPGGHARQRPRAARPRRVSRAPASVGASDRRTTLGGLAVDDDRQLLADAVARFAAERCPPDVARAAMEAPADARPPFWDDLAGLGWLDPAGGDLGVSELAVVLEQRGRSVAPGPALPAAWAAALLSAAGVTGAGATAGAGTATVAPAAALVVEDGTVSGTAEPVLCGAMVDAVVVPATVGGSAGGPGGHGDPNGQERWFLVRCADA